MSASKWPGMALSGRPPRWVLDDAKGRSPELDQLLPIRGLNHFRCFGNQELLLARRLNLEIEPGSGGAVA